MLTLFSYPALYGLPDNNPYGLKVYAFLRLCVADALAKLPPSYRDVIQLRMEGHDVAEIAARCGRSKRSIERILQESRVELSKLLGETVSNA